MVRRSLAGVLLALFLTLPLVRAENPPAVPARAPATAPAVEPRDLVTIRPGNLPLILSAPHGGKLPIPGATRRTGNDILIKRGVKNNFTMAFDGNVDFVALKLADEIERRTGKRPYIVVANFTRQHVDANRTPDEAYESDAGKAIYDRYHAAIREFRSEILRKWHRGLLIDIHGHGRDPEAIIRGTADWASVRHLVEEFGKDAIVGAEGLLGPIAAAGNKFIPPLDKKDEKEFAALNGGFITREYGSFQGGTFDAIQFELGLSYRKLDNIPTFAGQLADGIVPFMNRYLLIGAATRPATQPALEKVGR